MYTYIYLYKYVYSGSEFKRRTCKSITQVYPITGRVMNFKVLNNK